MKLEYAKVPDLPTTQPRHYTKQPTAIVRSVTYERGHPCRIEGTLGLWRFMALLTPNDKRRSAAAEVYRDGSGTRAFKATRLKPAKASRR